MDQKHVEKVVREVLSEVFSKTSREQPSNKPVSSRRLADENIARWLGHAPTPKQREQEVKPPSAPLRTEPLSDKSQIPKPKKPEKIEGLLEKSPARLGVWRAGTRYLTRVALKLRADHAVAKDAVYAELRQGFAETNGWVPLHTKAKDKDEFLLRPDLGRTLDEPSLQIVKEKAVKNPDVQIIVADGLSPWATDRHAKPMVDELIRLFGESGLTVGTIFCAKYSRIAIQDVIGEMVGAKVSMIILGERPGLGGGDSLSNYMIFAPKVGAVNAKKSMISNIHPAGHAPIEAARLTVSMVKKMLEQKCSGIELKI